MRFRQVIVWGDIMAPQDWDRPYRRWLALLPLVVALCCLLADTSAVDAATLVVNSTAEENLATPPNGRCTLIEALTNVNQQGTFYADCPAGNGINDTITFNIPAGQCPGGICQIAMGANYDITKPVTIDGYTQPGASPNTLAIGNNAVIRIRLTGLGLGPRSFTINASSVVIRGFAIGNFTENGIRIIGGSGARISGCFVGLHPDGITAAGNGIGIRIEGPASEARIGGTDPADRNVVSGQTLGIFVTQSPKNTIVGNYIGVNAFGTSPIPSGFGIQTLDSQGVVIGGTTADARNVISGNSVGIAVTSSTVDPSRTSNVIQGNYIGPAADGSLGATPNILSISLSGVTDNTIGGTAAGAGNVIAGVASTSISINSGFGNAILGNSIHTSFGLGIDLGGDGVTENDPGDTDTGPNNRQNFPVLVRANVGTNTAVAGTLNSTSNRTFRVEVFANTVCNASGNGEGETYLGFVNVTIPAGTNETAFIGSFPPVPPGRFLTATATDLTTNDTSELSDCLAVQPVGFTLTPITGPTTEANEGNVSDASFNINLTTAPVANVSLALSISDPTEGAFIDPVTLTFTPANALTPQTVRLLGVDDTIDDGDITYEVVFAPANSSDAAYAGLRPPNVRVVNLDNDPTLPPNVSTSVARAGPDRLLVTVSTPSGQTLQRLDWTLPPNARIEAQDGTPLPAGLTLPPGTTSTSFFLIRTGSSSVTLPFTVTGSFGTWRTFVGGGPDAWRG